MKYFRNLLIALMGRNPFQEELDKLRKDIEKAGKNVSALQDAYYAQMEKVAESETLLSEYAQRVTDYQKLIEVLRDRIRDYQLRISEYTKFIDGLQKPKAAPTTAPVAKKRARQKKTTKN